MGVHDLNWEFNICDPFGFRRPRVTHERGEDVVCARFVIVQYLALRVVRKAYLRLLRQHVAAIADRWNI
jgi:hypothetical protein